jgi:hypothetical protein
VGRFDDGSAQLSENALYTREAFLACFGHLTDDGINTVLLLAAAAGHAVAWGSLPRFGRSGRLART